MVQLQPEMSKFQHGNIYNKFLLVIHCPVGGHQKDLGYLAGNQVESEQFLILINIYTVSPMWDSGFSGVYYLF